MTWPHCRLLKVVEETLLILLIFVILICSETLKNVSTKTLEFFSLAQPFAVKNKIKMNAILLNENDKNIHGSQIFLYYKYIPFSHHQFWRNYGYTN